MINNTEKHMAYEEGISKGISQGINQGVEARNIEIAKNLLKLDNVSIEDISKATGLTLDEINTLK